MSAGYDIVIVGGGIAGGALAATLARGGVSVAVLERDHEPVDRVRGEFMALWGVSELEKLGLRAVLEAGGGIYSQRNVPYDENTPGEQALAYALVYKQLVPDVPGALCMSHPAMCSALCDAAEGAGATVLRGVEDIQVSAGRPPSIGFRHERRALSWRPRLIVGADGRNSRLRQQLGITLLADPPHNLLGGMLVEGVPEWPQDTQVIGTEGRTHFLIFPQGGDRVRLYVCYDFADKALYAGAGRQRKLVETFAGLTCLPHAAAIAQCRPIGPFNAFSNEDHWTQDPTVAGVVLIGDAAGHNDPIVGQGLSIALRDVRLVSEILLDGWRDRDAFRPYVEERGERMRRLRIAARLATTLRAEFGEVARQRRAKVQKRLRVDKMPSPLAAVMLGPDRLPADHFAPATLDALLAP